MKKLICVTLILGLTTVSFAQQTKQVFVSTDIDNFDRVDAINTINLCQLTFRGTWRKQYHDYEILNAKLLEALRKEYNLK